MSFGPHPPLDTSPAVPMTVSVCSHNDSDHRIVVRIALMGEEEEAAVPAVASWADAGQGRSGVVAVDDLVRVAPCDADWRARSGHAHHRPAIARRDCPAHGPPLRHSHCCAATNSASARSGCAALLCYAAQPCHRAVSLTLGCSVRRLKLGRLDAAA